MKDDLLYLIHMLDMAHKAQRYTKDKSRHDFDHDEILQLGLAHIVQTIGEAARQVSQAYRDAHPKIPWKPIIGMRHRVVHEYINLELNIVWQTVTEDIKPLIVELESLVPRHLWNDAEQDNESLPE